MAFISPVESAIATTAFTDHVGNSTLVPKGLLRSLSQDDSPMRTALFTKVMESHSLEDVIATAGEIGYDGVEIMAREPHLPADTGRERAETIAAALDDAGLSVPCLATYTGGYSRLSDEECEAELDALEGFLALAELLDVDLVRHGAGGPSIREANEEDVERAATWLRRAAELADSYDRTIGLEIHSHRLSETTESTLELLERIDHDAIGVIHDAGNMFLADDPFGPESVERLGDHLVHVHEKDLARVDDASLADTFALETPRGEELFRREFLGDGDVDHGPLFGALAERGYDGFVTAETTVRRVDEEEVAEKEFERLRGRLEAASS